MDSVWIRSGLGFTNLGKQAIFSRVRGMRTGSTARHSIVEGAPDHVSQVGGIEGRGQEIEGAGFDGLHVKTCVHDSRHDDHIHWLCGLLGQGQNVGPGAIGQLRVRED